ncbi:ComEC/Rec2 family competence protein [Aminobacter sp. BE82]|uniref:ComEC/Rec2 family competence protein n=1 Tax=Aminobacter sp. BE82 TaxID=2817838 RepID=UPI003D1DD915
MGDHVREGRAGERPVAETAERVLLAGGELSSPLVWGRRGDLQPSPASERHVSPASLRSRLRVPMAVVQARFTVRTLAAAVETELDRGAAFLLVPVFLAIGVLVYFGLAEEPASLPIASAALAMAAVAFAARTSRWLHYGLAAAAFCLVGMAAAKLETARLGTKMLGAEISTQLKGRVVEIDRLDKGRVRLTIDVVATVRPTLRYAPDRVRLTARRAPAGLAAGSLVGGYVRLMPPSGPIRPDSYDFSFESYFDGIGASGFFMKGPELVADAQPVPLALAIEAWLGNLRDRIAQRVRDRIGGVEGEIAAALMVGVRGGIPEEVNEALRRTGLYHIISISGLHMAMVAGTVMLGLRLGFAAFPAFASRHPVKKYAALAALASSGGYLSISGAEVAAQRSFIMLAVMLTAVLFDRAALTMRNLAISAIIVILVSPHEVVGPSFQMSFAATAALVGAYGWWSDRQAERVQPAIQRSLAGNLWRKLWTLAVGLLATSLIAGLATSVFGAWNFQRISPLSLFANLAVMPIVSVLVMPFAVAAGVLMPLGLDGLFLDTMGRGLATMVALAQWFSERSPVDAVGLISARAVILVSVALCIASMATTWLRFAALPFAASGLLLLGEARIPDILISEDGRLVGVPTAGGRLAVNRARPSDFITDSWKRALVAEELVGPVGAGGKPSTVTAAIAKSDASTPREPALPQEGGEKADRREAFVCDGGLCTIEHPSGAVIAHAGNAAAAKRACAVASLIVIDDATARAPCANSAATVVSKRDLARLGSVAAYLPEKGEAAVRQIEIQKAIAAPYRPWHEHRAFSREARGLPPFRRDRAKPPPEKAAP